MCQKIDNQNIILKKIMDGCYPSLLSTFNFKLSTKKDGPQPSFCGGGWTRTTELIRGQIYSLLQLPLCDSPEVFALQIYGKIRNQQHFLSKF